MTFNFELNHKPDKQGRYTVFLRITENRKSKRIKTSIELSRPSDWNKEKQRVRSSEPNAAVWNDVLDKELEKAKSTYRDLKEDGIATRRQVISKLKVEEGRPTLLSYARKVQDQWKSEGHFGNFKKYRDSINKLEGFLTDQYGSVNDVVFAEVTPEFVETYRKYMMTLPNHRDKSGTKSLHPNSISKHLRVLRAIINRAIDQDHYLPSDKNPFRVVDIKEIPTIKEKLEGDDISVIEQAELERGSLMDDARNVYLFSMYCAGIRLGDVIQLRWQNVEGGRLCYPMRKNDKYVNIYLVPQASEILDLYRKEDAKPSDYIFPYLDSAAEYARYISMDDKKMMPMDLSAKLFNIVNSKEVGINKQLKSLASKLGLKKFTFHSSRHTFARQAHEKGVSNLEIQRLMGHSNLNVTERYMKTFDTRMEDEAMEKMFAPVSKEDRARDLIKELKSLGLSAEILSNLLKED